MNITDLNPDIDEDDVRPEVIRFIIYSEKAAEFIVTLVERLRLSLLFDDTAIEEEMQYTSKFLKELADKFGGTTYEILRLESFIVRWSGWGASEEFKWIAGSEDELARKNHWSCCAHEMAIKGTFHCLSDVRSHLQLKFSRLHKGEDPRDDFDFKTMINGMRRAESMMRRERYLVLGNLLAAGELQRPEIQSMIPEGSDASELLASLQNGQSPRFSKYQSRHAWDPKAAAIAEEYKKRFKRDPMLPLKDFCGEVAAEHMVSPHTLYKKLTDHRDKWDPEGKYGRRSNGHR